MAQPYPAYQTICCYCGSLTSRAFAAKHKGCCKYCTEGIRRFGAGVQPPSRKERIIDHGYEAYAREEGHYDIPDNY